MYKQKKSSTLLVGLVALVVLLGVLISFLPTNAYFTSGDGLKIQAVVQVSPINFQVLQTIESEDIRINGDTYIDIANGDATLAILPGVENDLILNIKNVDSGNQSAGVKFKIEMFVLSAVNQNGTVVHTETPINIEYNTNSSEYSAATSESAGFWKNATDGYYYYVDNTSSCTNIAFAKNTTLTMMSKFKIPQSAYGTYNGENLKIVVTVTGINI